MSARRENFHSRPILRAGMFSWCRTLLKVLMLTPSNSAASSMLRMSRSVTDGVFQGGSGRRRASTRHLGLDVLGDLVGARARAEQPRVSLALELLHVVSADDDVAR